MRLEYDPDSGAAYLRLREEPVASTEEVAPGLLVDFAADGLPVGLDLLDAARMVGGVPPTIEVVILGAPPDPAAGQGQHGQN